MKQPLSFSKVLISIFPRPMASTSRKGAEDGQAESGASSSEAPMGRGLW
jgi:hypothetical protein